MPNHMINFLWYLRKLLIVLSYFRSYSLLIPCQLLHIACLSPCFGEKGAKKSELIKLPRKPCELVNKNVKLTDKLYESKPF